MKADGSQSEIALTRVPYPPHTNPASDAFAYVIPGNWQTDPRYSFPLPWSPAIPYRGVEDLAYSPDFDDTASPEYHSYLFLWWIEGTEEFTPERVQSDMLTYFRGLAEERGKNYGFAPDLAKVSARYSSNPQGAPSFGGAAAKRFRGEVSIYDTHGKVITLHSEVEMAVCPGTNHTAAFFGMSLEPAGEGIWHQVDRIRDTFRCRS